VTGVEILALALLLALPWGEGGATATALAVSQTLIFLGAWIAMRRWRREGETRILLPWALLAAAPLVIAGGISFLRAEYLFGSFETYWDRIVAVILALSLLLARRSSRFAAWSAGAVVFSARSRRTTGARCMGRQ